MLGNNAANAGRSQSRPPPFPEDVYTGAIRDYHALICETTEAPDELIAMAAILGISSLAARCISLPWAGGVMRPILFGCLIGASGRAKKTAAATDMVDLVVDPLRPRSTRPGEPDPFEIVRGHGSGEGLLEELADRQWWSPGANRKADPPIVQTGRQALFVFDEFGALLEKAARDQAGNLISFLLQLFDGSREVRHSTRSQRLVCTDCIGSIVAASTTDFLAKNLSESLIHQGLVNRFLFASGMPTAPVPMRPPIDHAAHQQLLSKLRGYMTSLMGRTIELAPDARAEYNHRYIQERQRPEKAPLIEAATGRMDILALRVAMVLAFAEGTHVISRTNIVAAWDLVAYSNQVVEDLLGRLANKTLEQAEAKLFRACRRVAAESGGSFARSEVRERLRGGNGMNAKHFTLTWDAACAAGDLLGALTPSGVEPRFVLAPGLEDA